MQAFLFFIFSFLFACNLHAGDLHNTENSTSLFDSIEVRRELVLNYSSNMADVPKNIKFKPYDILGFTASHGCVSAELSQYMSKILANGVVGKDQVFRPEVFSLPPLVRYIYQYGKCFAPVDIVALKEYLARPTDFFDHGTINHAIMRYTSWYLLAQYFPDLVWTTIENKKITSSELMRQLKSYMLRRFYKFEQDGQNEVVSSTYAMINLFPLLNIFDFVDDQELREGANQQAQFQIAVLRLYSYNGVILAPMARSNYQQRNSSGNKFSGDVAVSQYILWFYYGVPDSTVFDFRNRKEPFYLIMLALSGWKPSDDVLKLDQVGLPYSLSFSIPSFSILDKATVPEIYGDIFVAKDYAIGLGNLNFDPSYYNQYTQAFSLVFKSNSYNNQVECYHSYWNGNLDEGDWGRDRSSPFMQGFLSENSGVLLFDIPIKDPWTYNDDNIFFQLRRKRILGLHQFFQCRFPSSVDEIVFSDGWIFFRKNMVYVALATFGGVNQFSSTNFSEIERNYYYLGVHEPKGAVFFLVDSGESGGDFKSFQLGAKKRIRYFSKNDASFGFYDSKLRAVDVAFNADFPRVNGRYQSLPKVIIDGARFDFSRGRVPLSKSHLQWRGNSVLMH